MASTLATAFVAIRPDLSSFGGQLRSGMRKHDPKLTAKVDADTAKLGAPLQKKAEQQGREAGRRLGSGFSSGMAKMAGAGAIMGAATAVAGRGVLSLTSKASDLNETINQVRVIFGKSSNSVMAWSKNSNTALGLTRNNALNAAAGFGDLFLQLGINRREATKMSTNMVGLASDLASFKNADITQVIEAQSAAFRGEYDSLQRFIPNINAARVETEALRITGKKHVSQLTAADKALAVNAIMFKDSARAQGDFRKTSNGLANQQRILSARFDENKTALGQRLLPVMLRGTQFLNNVMNPAWRKQNDTFRVLGTVWRGVTATGEKFSGWIKTQLWPPIRQGITSILPPLIGLWRDVSKMFRGNATEGRALRGVIAAISTVLTRGLIPLLFQLIRSLLPYVRELFMAVGWTLNKIVIPAIKLLWTVFSSVIGSILKAAAKGFGWLPGIGPKVKAASREFEKFKRDVNASLNGIRDKKLRVTATAVVEGDVWRPINKNGSLGVARKATGGPVFGRGTETSDSIPAYLSNNEHVWTAREVRNAGGHGAVSKMRSRFRYASGGPVRFDVNAMGDTRPLRNARLDERLSQETLNWGGRLRRAYDHLWAPPVSGNWRSMWNAVSSVFPSAQLISSVRPGAITAVGTKSLHSVGKAIDISPRADIFNWIKAHYRNMTKELIFSPMGRGQLYNRREHYFGEPTRGDHFDHIHWGSYDRGGWIPPKGGAVNLSSRAEKHAVFTQRQWRMIEQRVGSGDTYVLQNNGVITTRDVEDWFVEVRERVTRKGRG